MNRSIIVVALLLGCWACKGQPANHTISNINNGDVTPSNNVMFDTTTRTIHVLVALCDNKYQGIVPVPKAIGNGQNPSGNLYWGCAYGIRTYFKNSKDWRLLQTTKIDSLKLERVIFKHKTANYYLVADAYNGKYIKECTTDFLLSISGKLKDTVNVNNTTLGIKGNAPLIAYIGHNGLMDFRLADEYRNVDGQRRKAIILACASKPYFSRYLQSAQADPLLWTTHLMAPEAYVLHDALQAYINNEGSKAVQTSAAKAYAKYQKCSENAARRLLVTGW